MLHLGRNEVVLLFYEKVFTMVGGYSIVVNGCGVVNLSLGNSSAGTETEREVIK